MKTLTDKEIKEGNKIIAEYMRIGERYSVVSPLTYHSNWNWLMEVVEKIESQGLRFKQCRRRVEICEDKDNPYASAIIVKEETKILSAWKGVVEFIEWHNNHNRAAG